MEVIDEHFLEALVEISELVESVLDDFQELEKAPNNAELSELKYDSLLRNIHSIKGALGMIDLKDQYKMVHEVETFLIDSYQFAKFSSGISDLMLDFWQKLELSLHTQGNRADSLMNFPECFNCLRKNNYEKVCSEHFQEIQNFKEMHTIKATDIKERKPYIYLVGKSPEITDLLRAKNLPYVNYHCVNEVYRNTKDIADIKTIFFDVDSLDVNPFLLQTVLAKFNLPIKICYLVNSIKDFSKLLDDVEEVTSSFCVVSKRSKSFIKEVVNLIE